MGIPEFDLDDREKLKVDLVFAINESLKKADDVADAAAELGVMLTPAQRWHQDMIYGSVTLQMMEMLLLTEILEELRKDKS